MDLRCIWETLRECSEVREDWSGHTMEPPAPVCFETVRRILLCLNKLPALYVTGRSSLQLEYRKPSAPDYLECEVFADYIYVLQVDGIEGTPVEEASHFWKFSCMEVDKVCELMNNFSTRLDY